MNDGELGRWLISVLVEQGTGRRVLLNRGWLPSTTAPPPVTGDIAVTGRVRGDGARNMFTPENKPQTGQFFRCVLPFCVATEDSAHVQHRCSPISSYTADGAVAA